MKTSAFQAVKQQIQPNEVYRRADLEFLTTAVDRHLQMLVKDGTLLKLCHGLYYAPIKSKFGVVPPVDQMLVERFLKDDNFLLLSPNQYNSLGLGLTQLYNVTWVYNHKRSGTFMLSGKTFIFKHKPGFPRLMTPEYLVVDLLNNIGELAEDTITVVENFSKHILRFNTVELERLVRLYGSRGTKKLVMNAIKTKLNA